MIDSSPVAWTPREADSRFRALVMATSDIVYSMSPDWSRMRFLDGKGFLSDTSESSEDWLARYIDPADQPQVLDVIGKAVGTKTTFDLVHRVRRLDGSLGWTHSRAIPLLDARGDIVEWFGAASDVTETRRAQEELFNERQRLRALLQALPVGVSFTDSPGCEHVIGNAALLDQFGITAGDDISASVDVQGPQIVYTRAGHRIRADDLPLQRAAREGRAVGPVELEVRLASGRTFSIEASAAPIRDASGEVIGAVAVSSDITDHKRVAEAREQARAKDEFLAVLGHELRNPLAAISGALDMLGSDVTVAQRDNTDELIRGQVGVIRRLVDDLLDLSRMTLGGLRLHKEGVSLTDLLQTAAAAAIPAATARSQDLVVKLESADLHFMADRVRLQQIVANLLDNAFKYGGQGGHVELSGGREGHEVVLRCQDGGQGIAPEMQGRIFEPLVRLESARLAAPAGLGLGLALVRHLAQLHGGSVSVSSAGLGAGSEFVVRIPFEEAAEVVSPAPPLPSPGPGGGALTIALAEDNPDVAQILVSVMERAGHSVRQYSDGPSALADIPASVPDVVMLDLGLPGMSGFELLARLRRHACLCNTVFIGISGLGVGAQTEGTDARFDHFLLKPIDIKELSNLLSRCSTRAEPLRTLLVEDHGELSISTVRLLTRERLEAVAVRTAKEAIETALRMRPQLLLCDLNLPDMQGLTLIGELREHLREWRTHVVVLTARAESELETLRSRADELGVHQFVAKPITAAWVRDTARRAISRARSDVRSCGSSEPDLSGAMPANAPAPSRRGRARIDSGLARCRGQSWDLK
jgi:PAS domain S-box-containing protein